MVYEWIYEIDDDGRKGYLLDRDSKFFYFFSLRVLLEIFWRRSGN